MKILYLCHRIPFPPNKGDKIRSFNEIKHLSRNHEIHLGCLADNPDDTKYERDLKEYCEKVAVFPLNLRKAKINGVLSILRGKPLSVGYFYRKELQHTINVWHSETNYDAMICFSSPMAEYLFRSPLLKQRFNPINPSNPRIPTLLMDFCDVDSDKWVQYSRKTSFPFNMVYRLEGKLLLVYEKKINRLFDHSIFVSDQEGKLFVKLNATARNVTTIRNGVDYDYFCSQAVSRQPSAISHNKTPVLLFTGAMDYHANVDGVVWFCREIFPKIKEEFPEARLYIVGSKPTPEVKELEKAGGVVVTGFVEDIREYYQIADISVIPLRIARGVQNKVLEAMSMGKAVVCTEKANQGIAAQDGRHVYLADSSPDFAKAVTSLIKDQKSREGFGKEARAFIVENFNWSGNMGGLESLLLSRAEFAVSNDGGREGLAE